MIYRFTCRSADGNSFEIKDVEALKRSFFPKYHGPTKFESFLRRLRRYGFERVKTETIPKSKLGPGAAVVLSFSHQNFQRDRPGLLGNVVIVAQQCEAMTSSLEKQTLASVVEGLEKAQAEMKATMKHFQNHRLEEKNQLNRLQHDMLSKDDAIRRLEFRLERLENTVLMAPDPFHRSQSLWAPQDCKPYRTESNSNFMPSLHSLIGPSSALKREISAMDILPLLEEPQERIPWHDEPTLARSKRMKYSPSSKTLNGFDGITLCRQTTPFFFIPGL